jgi:glycosyltransferase involved in cell wall biosynthesis
MLHGKPIACSHIGGLPEIVQHNVTGMLFQPGDNGQLTQSIRTLWESRELCQRLGRAARERAVSEHSSERYYERLMNVYERAIALGPGGPA